MKRKKLNVMNINDRVQNRYGSLSRDEMKSIIAGSCDAYPDCGGGGGGCYLECCGCMNSTCRTWVANESECATERYVLCGAGDAGDPDGPCATCVCA